MARASLHQQIVIKTEKDLLRLQEILSKKNPISDSEILSPSIKFANNKETAALLRKWGTRY
ncbi:MAG: hypothetical protein LBN20_02390 [Endomicrobium sp.]|jgi:hypothetical protein|nr:hypothetical protein [Endomicrobium sp.]